MKNIKLWVLLLLITITLEGCGNGYFFTTIAIYYAKDSNLKVKIIAKGFVLDGDDLTDGLSTGEITSLKFTDTIYFQANTTEVISLEYRDTNIKIPSSFTTSLAHCLDKIGHSTYNKQELVELGEIISSIAYGPKGTYVNGQTDLIKVISVDFETNRGEKHE